MELMEVVAMLRRRIGDTVEPYLFQDDELIDYLKDAVASVELDWHRGYEIVNGTFNKELTRLDATLFCIKAHYLIKLRTKDKADRDNFRMVKGRLTLDNTNQASDHKDTLEIIDKEYRRALYRAKTGGSLKGVRME